MKHISMFARRAAALLLAAVLLVGAIPAAFAEEEGTPEGEAVPEAVYTVPTTIGGCVGVLDTGRPGPVTTLRFDIDCLAIEELFDANKLDQKTLEATFARYNELTQPARTPTSAAASTRKQSRSAKRPSTSPK